MSMVTPEVTRPEHAWWMLAQMVVVEPNYFATLQIPTLAGRTFHSESGSSATTIVLGATAAEMLWPGD